MYRDSKQIVSQAVSERTGPIKHLHRLHVQRNDPKIFCFYAETSNSNVFGDFLAGDRNSGAGLDPHSAKLATVGEFFERYCCSFRQPTKFGCAEDFSNAVPPSAFALFSEEQYSGEHFPFARFNNETRVAWTPCTSALSGDEHLVPAQMVFMPYSLADGELPIAPQLSHGLACHQSFEKALLSALYELVERDAFTTFWMLSKSVPCISVTGASKGPEADFLRDAIGSSFFVDGISYIVFDITTEFEIPTYFVVSRSSHPTDSIVTVGAASRISAKDALKKAFLEAAQARPYIRHIRSTEPGWRALEGFSNVNSFDEHARLYSYHPELFRVIEALRFQGSEGDLMLEVDLGHSDPDTSVSLRKLVERLVEKNFDPLYVDLTTPDAEDLGLSVVRAVVPGLHQLHGDHLFPFLGGSRLCKESSKTSGGTPSIANWKSDAYPHPFP